MPDDLSCFICGMPVYEPHEYKELKRGEVVCNHCIEAGRLSGEQMDAYSEIYK